MKRIFTLLFTFAAFLAVSMNLKAQVVDMGKDWDPDAKSLINAVSEVYFVQNQKEYTVNPGGDDEVMFIVGGAATAQPSANKDVYANPTSESFSYVQIGTNDLNGTWFEGHATGPVVISSIKINGTSGAIDKTVTGGILYSDQAPFNENSIIGYGEVALPVCRAGNAGVIIDNVPAGTKSFRIYNPAKIEDLGTSYALATEGEDIITVGDKNQSFRVAYASVTLSDGAPAVDPTLTKVSGNAEQTFYLGQNVSDIIYRWGGTATSASVTWDGGTTPAGIDVSKDSDAKTVTISGTPAAAGVFNYTVVATDGVKTTEPLTGTITVNTITADKKLIAYVTTLASPVDPADVAVLAKLRESYEVDIVIANGTSDAAKPASTFDVYDAIVLAALPGSGNVPNCLKSINKPLVSLKPYMFQNANANCWDWGTPANLESASNPKTLDDVPTGVAVNDAAHPVFAGMGLSNGDVVELATGSKHGSFRLLTPVIAWRGDNEENIINLAGVPTGDYNYATNPNGLNDASGMPVIFEIKPNSVMVNGNDVSATVLQKTIHIGVSEQAAGPADNSYTYLTADYLTIVKNAVDYVLGGDDVGIQTPVVDSNKVVVNKAYFDITGRRVSAGSKGLVIEKLYYEDGTTGCNKVFIRK